MRPLLTQGRKANQEQSHNRDWRGHHHHTHPNSTGDPPLEEGVQLEMNLTRKGDERTIIQIGFPLPFVLPPSSLTAYSWLTLTGKKETCDTMPTMVDGFGSDETWNPPKNVLLVDLTTRFQK